MNATARRTIAAALFALPLAAFAAQPFNCQTISQPGYYTLTKNLTSTGNCIVIDSSFVTLDLAGFTISGTGAPSSVGISEAEVPIANPTQFNGIVIRNGNITNFDTGILIELAPGVTVENVNASLNLGTGIILGNSAVVRSSRFDQNGGNGLNVFDNAIITGNTATHNGNVGINAGMGSIIVNNQAANNKLTGIAQDCPGAAIANTVTFNGPTFDGPNVIQTNGTTCVFDHNSTQ